MRDNCINYDCCRKPVEQCNHKCECFNNTCWSCVNREHEECGLTGREVFDDTIACNSYEIKTVIDGKHTGDSK